MHHNVKEVVALERIEISENGTIYGEDLDLPSFEQGVGSLEFFIISDTITDGVHTVGIVEGDVADPTVDVPADEVLGAAAFGADDDNTVKRIGSVGKKPHTRLKIVSTGVTDGGFLSAIAVLGHPNHMPVPDSAAPTP